MPSKLNKPSEFYYAVIAGLISKIGGDVAVLAYSDFNSQIVAGIQIYVEIEGINPSFSHSDGRNTQQLEIRVHSIVSRSIESADLKALDLASAIARVVKNNCWGLGDAVDFPEHVSAQAGMLETGENAFEGWSVSFYQTIYLGEPEDFNPAVTDVRLAANADNEADANEYGRVGNV